MPLPTLQQLAQAISQNEGFGPAQNIPTLANNPGDLELGDVGYGTITDQGGNQITVFGSLEDGWSALTNQLNKIVNGQSSVYSPNTTLQQFGQLYSGGNPSYGASLANSLGVDPNTPIASLAPSNSQPPANSTNPIDVVGNLTGLGTGAGLYTAAGSPNIGTFFGFSNWSAARIIVLILGIILIAAGVFSFKQSTVAVNTATRAVKTANRVKRQFVSLGAQSAAKSKTASKVVSIGSTEEKATEVAA